MAQWHVGYPCLFEDVSKATIGTFGQISLFRFPLFCENTEFTQNQCFFLNVANFLSHHRKQGCCKVLILKFWYFHLNCANSLCWCHFAFEIHYISDPRGSKGSPPSLLASSISPSRFQTADWGRNHPWPLKSTIVILLTLSLTLFNTSIYDQN